MRHFVLMLLAALLFLGRTHLLGESFKNESYEYGAVPVGAGGFITGVGIHPKDHNFVLARCDVGGLFRWDGATQKWTNLQESFPMDTSVIGCAGFAFDAANPNVIYASYGYLDEDGDTISYNPGSFPADWQPGLYKSSDRGNTWHNIFWKNPTTGKPIYPGSNLSGKAAGEHIAVDPKNSDILFYGTCRQGLWISRDATSDHPTFTQVPLDVLPPGGSQDKTPWGIRTILVDDSQPPLSGPVRSSVIYVAEHDEKSTDLQGVWRSGDGGLSWKKIGTYPHINRMISLGDGQIMICGWGTLARYSGGDAGTWTDLKPLKDKTYTSLAANPQNPNEVWTFALTAEQTNEAFFHTTAARTIKDGSGFTQLPTQEGDASGATKAHYLCQPDCLAVDPVDPKIIWTSDVYGLWRTDDATASPIVWSAPVRGLEVTVAHHIHAPRGGPTLVYTGVEDVGAYAITDLNSFGKRVEAAGGLPNVTSSIGSADVKPANVLCLMTRYGSDAQLARSTDYGQTWTKLKWKIPNGGGDPKQFVADPDILVGGATGKKAIYRAFKSLPWTTEDAFSSDTPTWQIATGMDKEVSDYDGCSGSNRVKSLIRDKHDPETAYYMVAPQGEQAKIYRTTDFGKTWEKFDNVMPAYQWPGKCCFDSSPSHTGYLWSTQYKQGLWRSTDGGKTWTKVPGVNIGLDAAVGAPASTGTNDAVYICGQVGSAIDGATGAALSNVYGIFRSTDQGQSWVRISNNSFQAANPVLLEADPGVYGRVYIRFSGAGVHYIQLAGTPTSRNL